VRHSEPELDANGGEEGFAGDYFSSRGAADCAALIRRTAGDLRNDATGTANLLETVRYAELACPV